jgi:hypothetical protein
VNEIEANLLKENISSLKTSEPTLTGEQGLQLSKELLRTLRAESQPTEAKREYESRMTKQGIEVLGIKEALQ